MLYVGDIILTGSYAKLIDQFVKSLSREFDVKNLGSLRYFLDLEIYPHSKGLHISQLKYALDLLYCSSMTDCKPASTLLVAKVYLTAYNGVVLNNASKFRQLVGSLQYLTLTHPDILFAISIVAQFLSASRQPHLIAVKQILCYIKGFADHEIFINLNSMPMTIHAFSNAD